VKTTEGNQSHCPLVDIYHVHRNILAIGERRSAYFANLFHYGIDDGDHCTNVELSSRAAAYFPELLDYMYSSHAFSLATRNAVALLFLAQSFNVLSLQSNIFEFIERDIRPYNFGYYMSEGLFFCEERITLKAVETCEREVMRMCSDTQLFSVLRSPLSASVASAEEKIQCAWVLVTRLPETLAFRRRLGEIAAVTRTLSKGTPRTSNAATGDG
jgi:BTB/POZ domain